VSAELSELYQEVVLDHGRKPRNFRCIADATHQAEGLNPLCGDHFKVYAKVEGDVIRDLAFEGSGCAISKASASVMTGALKGKTTAEAESLFERFHEMVTGGPGGSVNPEDMGKLAVFSGVWEFPTRVKCASLAWHALRAALRGEGAVSTE
jgi:nitrogen fixation NifU-like protein